MKIFFISLFCILTVAKSFSQTLQLPTSKETSVREDSNNSKVVTLNFKLLDRMPGAADTISFKDIDDGTASRYKDYQDTSGKGLKQVIVNDSTGEVFSLLFTVFNDTVKEIQEYFNIYISYKSGDFIKTEKLKITIDDPEKLVPISSSIDTSKWSVKLITGSNFDFFGTGLFKNFAGELKIFVPSFTHNPKKHPFGLQTGLFNYQYYESDSSQGRVTTERYLTDPTVTTLVPGTTKYVSDVYALNSKVTYNNWGAYVNPMVLLKGNEWFDLYADLHLEGVWRTSQTTFTKVPLRKDTLTFSVVDSVQGKVLQAYPGIRALYQENKYWDFYVGIGFPFKLNIKSAFELYLDPTIGLTNFTRVDYSRNTAKQIVTTSITTKNSFTPFGLLKFQLTTKVAPVDIVLGGEFRIIAGKQLDQYPAYKAFYLGAVLPLDSWIRK